MARRRKAAEKIGPTPEQRRRYVYEVINPAEIDSREQPIGQALRNVSATPLDRYHARRQISDRQFLAGDRFRADWHVSGLQPRLTPSYSDAGALADPAWQMPTTERAARARWRYRDAIRALGIRLSHVAVMVCIEGADVDLLGRDLGRSDPRGRQVAGMTALRLALDSLADHYGMAA